MPLHLSDCHAVIKTKSKLGARPPIKIFLRHYTAYFSEGQNTAPESYILKIAQLVFGKTVVDKCLFYPCWLLASGVDIQYVPHLLSMKVDK